MGLLDDLQQQVDKIKADEVDRNAELEAQEAFYSDFIQPAMLQAYDYFSKIIDNLNIVQPEINVSYPLNPSLEQGVLLKQADYKFSSDNGKSPRQIDILCTLSLDGQQQFRVRSKEAVLKQADLIDSYKFPYHRRNHLDSRHDISGATFILEGPMKAHIRILAHPAERCIYVGLRNLETQPVKSYKFAPDKMDDELLERLARVLLREESQLIEVKVRDEVRDDLRRQVELQKRRDEKALAQAYAQAEAERLEQDNSRLVNRVKRAIAERADGVLKALSRH